MEAAEVEAALHGWRVFLRGEREKAWRGEREKSRGEERRGASRERGEKGSVQRGEERAPPVVREEGLERRKRGEGGERNPRVEERLGRE